MRCVINWRVWQKKEVFGKLFRIPERRNLLNTCAKRHWTPKLPVKYISALQRPFTIFFFIIFIPGKLHLAEYCEPTKICHSLAKTISDALAVTGCAIFHQHGYCFRQSHSSLINIIEYCDRTKLLNTVTKQNDCAFIVRGRGQGALWAMNKGYRTYLEYIMHHHISI